MACTPHGLSELSGDGFQGMRITARPVHDHPVQIVPAPTRRQWPGGAAAIFDDPSLQAATARGWDLLCPYAFEATWNGGSAPEDIVISAPGFVNSVVGHGILTFETGYAFSLAPGHDLWVRGPINHLTRSAQALEQVLPNGQAGERLVVHWRLTRPGETVSFARGEPFATILPYPAGYAETFEGRIWTDDAASWPGISCICPTYGRPHLLEEAIESFLRQDYPGPKELIVLNDLPEQHLVFEYPGVHVVNVGRRFRTLGEKLNTAVALCTYDLVSIWSDDDVYLPHRLSQSVERWDATRAFYKAGQAFLLNDGALSGPFASVLHGGSLYSRDLFVQARGYPHLTDGVDQRFEAVLERLHTDATQPDTLTPAELFHVYRWGGSGSYHLSALGNRSTDQQAAYRAVADFVAREIVAGRQPTGRIALQPRWHEDYEALVASYLNGHGTQDAVTAASAQSPAAQSSAQSAGRPAIPQTVADLPRVEFSQLPRALPEAEALACFAREDGVRISVVLPACNERPFLERTVAQFAATLPPRSEVIVVDNGSKDGCSEFLAPLDAVPADGQTRTVVGYAAPDGVVVRLARHRERLGVAGARNRGLRDARGEIVVFADAHVDVPPHWWHPVARTLRRPEVGVVGPAFGVIGSADYPKGYGQRIADATLRVEWLECRGDEPYPVPALGGGFMAIRASVLEDAGGFDDGMSQWGSEDTELSLRYWLLGYEAWVIPELEIPHQFREASPYTVEWRHTVHNTLRTAFLHLSEERLARVIQAVKDSPEYPDAMAMIASGDTMKRREELFARRNRDDHWFFNHADFADIEMELRAVPVVAVR